jgi:four helix bundle protein
MRRGAVSIASNIAEGNGRMSKGEYVQFLGLARDSNYELQTQLIIAEGLGFGDQKNFHSASRLSADVSRLLLALIKSLRI